MRPPAACDHDHDHSNQSGSSSEDDHADQHDGDKLDENTNGHSKEKSDGMPLGPPVERHQMLNGPTADLQPWMLEHVCRCHIGACGPWHGTVSYVVGVSHRRQMQAPHQIAPYTPLLTQ